MITTIYRCDRCGYKQPKPEQMWNVGTVCFHHGDTPNLYSLLACTKLWCRACVNTYQLIVDPPTKPDAPPPLSLEDKIREIIRETVAEESR